MKADLPVQVEGHWFGNACGNEFSVPAWQFNACHPGRYAKWTFLLDLGRGEGCMGLSPVTAPSATSFEDAPCLEYQVYFPEDGDTDRLSRCPSHAGCDARTGAAIGFWFDGGIVRTLDARQGFVHIQ